MPYSPVPPTFGGALREYYLLKSLTREHTVTTLTFGTEEELVLFKKDFGDLVKAVHMIKPPWTRTWKRVGQLCSLGLPRSYAHLTSYCNRMQDKIDELLSAGQFDAVHCEFSVMCSYTFDENLIRIANTHNVEYVNFRRMSDIVQSPLRKWFYHREYKKMHREEIRYLENYDAVFSTSEPDRLTFRKDIPDVPNYVIPNGVDTSYFRPSPWYKTDPNAMVFTGAMGYVPNNDGMLYFLDEIFPRVRAQIPAAKIYIVGNRPSDELRQRASEHIIVTGFVDDVRPFVWRSRLFVVPLRMGSGTRLKVIEALAMKKPVVSTSVGCEGIDIEHGKSILMADEPDAFAESIIRLMREEDLREELMRNGYKLIKDKYDWTVIGDKMLEVYESLEHKKQPKPRGPKVLA